MRLLKRRRVTGSICAAKRVGHSNRCFRHIGGIGAFF
jgi:hypothetical protein